MTLSVSTTETLKILMEQVSAKTTAKLTTFKERGQRKAFIAYAHSYRPANDGDIDWDWVYDNWKRPGERK